MKSEGRVFSATKTKRRLGQVFVLSEFVFSLVLLILGVLLTKSFIKLQQTNPGFDANNLLVFRLVVPEVNYGRFIYGAKDPRRERLYRQVEQALTERSGINTKIQSIARAGHWPSSPASGD